jgi:hypothetical protein
MSVRQRRRTWAVGVAAVGALVAAGIGPMPAALAAAAPEVCWTEVASDFDGGGPDVAIGMPSFDLPGKPDAGAVAVYSNVALADTITPKAPTAKRIYTANDFPGLTAQAGAHFGADVGIVQDWGADDGDSDDCNDLLVGAPGQTVDGKAAAGALYLLAGAPGGLSEVRRTITEDSLEGPGSAQAGAHFGAAIAVETALALMVGAPGRDVDGHADAGRVVRVDLFGLDSEKDAVVIEQGGLATGSPEAGDQFGEELAMTVTGWGPVLAVGAPHEDIGHKADAGAVFLLPTKGAPSSINQDSPGAGGAAEAGDEYGASVTTAWTFDAVEHLVGVVFAGVPGEDVGSAKDAGAVSYASFLGPGDDRDAGPLRGLARTTTQDSPHIPGSVEAGDAFGSAVLAGSLGPSNEPLDLVVGAPLEGVGRHGDAGLLTMTKIEPYGAPTPGATQPGPWSQDSPGVAGVAGTGDRFGAQFSSIKLTQEIDDDSTEVWPQLVVTVPREDVSGVKDAGMAYIGYTPGKVSVPLVPPILQAGAGIGMAPMRVGQQ